MKKILYYSLLLASTVSCGKKHKQFKYPNGQIKIDIEVNENGERDGETIYYFENGNIEGITMCKNGLRNGANIMYFKNEKIYLRDFFKNDTLNGFYQEYYESGFLRSQQVINMGMVTGRVVEFYDTTGFIIKTATTYKNNMRNGESSYYDYDRKYITRFSYIKDSLMFYVDYNKDGSEKVAHFPLTQKEQKEELQNSTNIE
ncbi:MAG: hypothetical protein H7331_10625 [Bacteroidia bacterium]|nr:hypothetical protein [Bacteroidia bacterium]